MSFKIEDRLTAYIVAALLALEVMLSFSSFGYISIGVLTLSFVPIGVYAMAFFFNLKLSLLASFVFGVTSMMVANVGSGRELDYLYSPILSGSPVASIILAIGTRFFLGFISWFTIKRAVKSQKNISFNLMLATFESQAAYTLITFIVGALLFPHISGDHISVYNVAFNLLLETIMFSFVVINIYKVTQKVFVRNFLETCRQGVIKTSQKENILYLSSIAVLFMLFNIGIGIRYWQMNIKTFKMANITLDAVTRQLLFRLEIQQLLSVFALSTIIIIVGMIVYFYVIERQDKLMYRANRDMMTGLYNREAAKIEIQAYRNIHPNTPYAFIMVDIDGLKQINDNLGHAAGDEAINGASNALKSVFGKNGIVARMGGDEFMVFLGGVASEEALTPSLQELQKNIATVSIANGVKKLHVSIGVKLDVTGQMDIKEVYHAADEALYYVKKSGKNMYAYHK